MSETQEKPIFNIEKCRAKLHGAGDLVDCLALEQVRLCDHVLPFGSGFFCKHPQRMKFIEKQAHLDKVKSENNQE